ncbi:MAG: sigma-70 family RNA polymerase sigma factor [Chloroflexi bacterium]|nr:sigma-70 family RNA polymerase sigma factor [Chloroflexota bacterium]
MAVLANPTTPSAPLLARLLAASGEAATEEIAAGRAVSFEEIYRAHYRDVYRYVLVMSHEPDEADDVVAEVFTRGFQAWRAGRGPAGRPLPWLLLICKRLLTDRWRRRRLLRWVRLAPADSDSVRRDTPAPDVVAGEHEFWMWLDSLARSLPARQREVLLLRYQRDLTDGEIGDVLGLSESGVRSLAARAVAALRRHPELWS